MQVGFAVEPAVEESDVRPAPVIVDAAGRAPRATVRSIARNRSVEPHVGQHQHLGQLEMRPRQHGEEVLDHADRVVAVEQRRAERPERARPGAHDRDAERNARPLDREGHQQAQAALVLVAVADDREPDLAVLEARHGRRQETRVEEDVRLDGARAQIVEFLDQIEAGRCRDRSPACAAGRRSASSSTSGRVDGLVRDAGSLGDHRAGRAAARFFQKRDRGHQLVASVRGGTKIAMTMPSRRYTVKESAAASNIMETAVAMAAPHRPYSGIRTMLSAMFSASVSA